MKKLMMAVTVGMMGMAAMAAMTTTSFAYQGVLRDELGQPLGKEQATIKFRIYDVATGGSAIWTKEMNLAIDTNGLFNAELSGSDIAKAIADAESNGKTLYVGLTVAGSAGEITPRQKMIPTPLASYAQNVAKAQGNFTVDGTAYFNGNVSMSGENKDATFYAKKVDVASELDVTGEAILKGGSELYGKVTVADSLTVRGVQMSMPIGSIIMWSGAADELPTDGCWALCDGQTEYLFNGNTNDVRKVPDLRGRFIVGVGTATSGTNYVAGATGGEEFHTLTVDELANHYHESYNKYWTGCNFEAVGWDCVAATSPSWCIYEKLSGKNNLNQWFKTDFTGGDQPHENRPPYYALCYIIKIK